MDPIKFKIVILFAIGFAFASMLGYFSERLKLSPILGYLIAGYSIGPYSPGFVADLQASEQLAELGVVLMMFGVGLHFKWQDLISVKNIAIPGAIGQTLITTLAGALLVYLIGWPVEAGMIFGFSIGIASTVLLVRVLAMNKVLNTPEGHIAVGWLIVEDLLTVVLLLLLPLFAAPYAEESFSFNHFAFSIATIIFKFVILCILLFTVGLKAVSYILTKVAHTRSHELFTLTILATTFTIATISIFIFGISIALGAFLAGMVIGQTRLKHEVAANTTPLRDTFIVFFFLAIGMLFNPFAIVDSFLFFVCALLIILVLKPLVAIVITSALRYPYRVGITVAIALAQIGEFSFIMAEQANALDILPDPGYDIIVACAFISIAVNPPLFKLFHSKKGSKS